MAFGECAALRSSTTRSYYSFVFCGRASRRLGTHRWRTERSKKSIYHFFFSLPPFVIVNRSRIMKNVYLNMCRTKKKKHPTWRRSEYFRYTFCWHWRQQFSTLRVNEIRCKSKTVQLSKTIFVNIRFIYANHELSVCVFGFVCGCDVKTKELVEQSRLITTIRIDRTKWATLSWPPHISLSRSVRICALRPRTLPRYHYLCLS